MITKSKLIKHAVTAKTNGTVSRSKKACLISWQTLPTLERPMSGSQVKSDPLKKGMYLRCRLVYKPTDTGNTRYELRMLTDLYMPGPAKKSFKICGEFCCRVHLDTPVEMNLFAKKVDKKGLMLIIRNGMLAFFNDYNELRNEHKKLLNIVFLCLPPDKELTKLIDYKDKNERWEYEYKAKQYMVW
jgi:hypothetical protein